MPGTVSPGQTIAFDVTIRNDGWDTWPEGAGYQLGVDIRPGAILPRMLLQDPNAYPVRADLSKAVPPGGTVTVPLSLVVSAEPGYYTVQFDVIAPDIGTFESHNDLPWQKVLNIAGG